MKNKPFNESQFVATKWSTPQDKAKFANDFANFVKNGFKKSSFKKKFYNRLSQCRSHIAHYDLNGFYDEWFSTEEKQNKFLDHWMNYGVCGDPTWTYSDVEKELMTYLRKEYSLFV